MMETVLSEDLRNAAAVELERVLASEYFRTSKQAERLLRYLVTQSLGDHIEELRERAIGERVFGRQPKYDSNADSIVRVWANHLRKRLAQYYQADGRNDTIRFAMRPGTYRIEFQQIAPEFPPESPAAPPAPVLDRPVRGRRSLWLVSVLTGVLAIACAWLAYQNSRLRNETRGTRTPPPPLNLLWSRMFGGRLGAEIILADSNLSLFQDLLHKTVTLQDYARRDYLRIGSGVPYGAQLEKLIARRYTSTADVDILRRALLLAGPESLRIEVAFARDLSPDDLKSRNVVLLGSNRSNPWVEAFEAQMNFRFDYNIAGGNGAIVNSHPRAGEQPLYSGNHESYGLLAFQPNLAHTGSALIIGGLGIQGTLAAGELATNAELFKQVVTLLPASARGELPYFEVVLKAEMMGSTVHGFKIMAWRSS